MSSILSTRALRLLNRKQQRTASTTDTELNITPLLDVVMNVMLFVLATLATTFAANIPIGQQGADSGYSRPQPVLTISPQGYELQLPNVGYLTPNCDRFVRKELRFQCTVGNTRLTRSVDVPPYFGIKK